MLPQRMGEDGSSPILFIYIKQLKIDTEEGLLCFYIYLSKSIYLRILILFHIQSNSLLRPWLRIMFFKRFPLTGKSRSAMLLNSNEQRQRFLFEY